MVTDVGAEHLSKLTELTDLNLSNTTYWAEFVDKSKGILLVIQKPIRLVLLVLVTYPNCLSLSNWTSTKTTSETQGLACLLDSNSSRLPISVLLLIIS